MELCQPTYIDSYVLEPTHRLVDMYVSFRSSVADHVAASERGVCRWAAADVVSSLLRSNHATKEVGF